MERWPETQEDAKVGAMQVQESRCEQELVEPEMERWPETREGVNVMLEYIEGPIDSYYLREGQNQVDFAFWLRVGGMQA